MQLHSPLHVLLIVVLQVPGELHMLEVQQPLIEMLSVRRWASPRLLVRELQV